MPDLYLAHVNKVLPAETPSCEHAYEEKSIGRKRDKQFRPFDVYQDNFYSFVGY